MSQTSTTDRRHGPPVHHEDDANTPKERDEASKVVVPERFLLEGGKSPSEYQLRAFEFLEKADKQNGIIHAVAGSGKTSTLVKLVQLARGKWPDAPILVLAFNKKIQEELSARLANVSSVDCRTLNAFGLAALKGHVKSVNTNEELEGSALERDLEEIIPENQLKGCKHTVARMLERCKNNLWSSEEDVKRALPIDLPADSAELVQWTCLALSQCGERCKRAIELKEPLQVTFTDQLWLPVKLKLPTKPYKLVFVDEAQDLNRCQIHLIKSAIDPNGGRLMAAGDPNQAIYDFRGASCNAMALLNHDFRATSLSLSVCYRCPLSVIRVVRNIVPEIEATADAIEGAIEFIHEGELIGALKPGDVVLSRTNAAIVTLALKLAQKHVHTSIRQADILIKSVKALLSKFNTQMSTVTLGSFLDSQLEYITSKLEDKQITEETAAEREDIIEVIRSLGNAVGASSSQPGSTASTLIEKTLTNLFNYRGTQVKKVMLYTVHQVKGLEFPKVHILFPTFRTKGNVEERNLLYVALTRTKDKLVVVGCDRESLVKCNRSRHIMFTGLDRKLIDLGYSARSVWPFVAN